MNKPTKAASSQPSSPQANSLGPGKRFTINLHSLLSPPQAQAGQATPPAPSPQAETLTDLVSHTLAQHQAHLRQQAEQAERAERARQQALQARNAWD